ncbi:proline-rich receptor-like protein kinase PERK9 [Iris pallida]|uniref:Proline-rich receptor-like protein kinase PERK9 n=1 Tax=Iris pallida TaxID=29817 RepID=A0AAX6F787_IRIPA|nr:proline-rich receptor-like protein kinase PERK9 [Iris pallida]
MAQPQILTRWHGEKERRSCARLTVQGLSTSLARVRLGVSGSALRSLDGGHLEVRQMGTSARPSAGGLFEAEKGQVVERCRKTCCHGATAELDRTSSSTEDPGVVRLADSSLDGGFRREGLVAALRRGDGSGFGDEVR